MDEITQRGASRLYYEDEKNPGQDWRGMWHESVR
jgi:hypothetical protein